MTILARIIRARRFRVAALAAFVLVTASPLTARAQFLHPKIKKNETIIRNIIILPAKVEIVRDTMKGPEGMAAESEELSEKVGRTLAAVLADKKHVKTLNTPAATSGEGDLQRAAQHHQ